VNASRKAAGDEIVDDEGNVLPMSDVLKRLAVNAEKEAARASVDWLRARAVAVKICGDADDSLDAIELAVAAETGEICRGDDARKPFERFLSELATLAADDGKSGAKKKAAAPRRSSRRGRGATVAEEPEDDEIEAASDDDRDKWDVDDDDDAAAAAAARESGGEEDDDDDDENADDKRFLLVERVRKHRARYKTADAAATGAAKAAESTLSKSRDKRSSLNYLLRQMEDCEKERDAVEDGGEGGDDPAYDANQCPICLDTRDADSEWSLAPCGHGGCYECIKDALHREHKCPICRKPMTAELLLKCAVVPDEGAAAARAAAEHAPSSSAAVAAAAGEWGTKLSALLKIVGDAERAGEKVVIFSAWTRLLKLATSALEAHDIVIASLVGSPERKREALAAFAKPPRAEGATVLLVPLFGGASGQGGGGAAGLTLTAARTAVLLEPALQPGIEAQAAGRISRLGQKKTARVVRLIVKDTIEEKIVSWQARRMANLSKSAALGLNDFVQLGLAG